MSRLVHRDPLPVESALPELIAQLRQMGRAVLKAPTGAGKTTRVPPALWRAGMGGGRTILMIEPRRLAAVAAARRIAQECGLELGCEVGFHIRFERRASDRTRILVATEGMLLRYLQDDPFLESTGMVIFDEFHERSLNSDLGLAMVRRIQSEFRPDLQVLAMSATLDLAPLARFLDGPVVTSEGRLFPVAIHYQPRPGQAHLPQHMAAAIRELAPRLNGHLLAFLPGVAEIRRTRALLLEWSKTQRWALHDLHGQLPVDEQEAVLCETGQRKIVLATNVAETSVTVDGVEAVVDGGVARMLRFDAAVGLNRLQLGRISRAAADQRAGRAGRTGPGICVRLWSEAEQRSMREFDLPEVQRIDLTGAVLQLHCWGEADARSFPWFENPPDASLRHSQELLETLGAVRDGQVTALGRRLARLPIHPRLAAMLSDAAARRCGRRMALAAAVLSERDPFRVAGTKVTRPQASDSDSDVLDRVRILEAWEQAGQGRDAAFTGDRQSARIVLRTRDQLWRELRAVDGRGAEQDHDESFLRALLAGFPDRVARRRRAGSRQAVMVGGRGVRLSDDSAVRTSELFLCVDIEEIGKSEALVRQASRLERAWLPESQVRVQVDVEFDEERERVVAFQRVYYSDLVLEEAATDASDPQIVSQRLAQEAGQRLLRALPMADEAVQAYLTRVRWLREWLPELGLPPFDEGELRALLPDLCAGRRSFAELRRLPLVDWLRGLLSPAQQAALDRDAPERLTVPTGKKLKLQYEPGRPPVLAVRIQDVFGWRESPRLAGGRVPVLLHLLAPNMRPQQITDDLASFWRRGYAEARKELRRRYPKHAWPEDPSNG